MMEITGKKANKDLTPKFHALLQNDALTERITSELEQLNYAQILTSLATGLLQNDDSLKDSVKPESGKNELKASQTNDSLNMRTFELDEQTLDSENGKLQSNFSSRRKRRVKPSRKMREIQEIKDVKRHGFYANEFGRPKKVNAKIVRENSKNSVEKRVAKTTKKNSEGENSSRNEMKFGIIVDDCVDAAQTEASEDFRNKIISAENLDENERNEMGKIEKDNELTGNEEDGVYTRRKSRKTTKHKGNKATEKGRRYWDLTEGQSRNSKENEDESSGRYQCEQCGKFFKTYYTFSIHIRMPEHTKEAPFVCDVCGKGFRLSSTLCRHKIIHTSNKPHECKVCRKTFNRSSTLKMHMRTHSARKQHVCSTCGKGFHQKGNLRNHMFVHSGERPFCCETCGRHFNKKSNLKHHLKIHEINGKYSCTICKKIFDDHIGLKEHMQTKHVHL